MRQRPRANVRICPKHFFFLKRSVSQYFWSGRKEAPGQCPSWLCTASCALPCWSVSQSPATIHAQPPTPSSAWLWFSALALSAGQPALWASSECAGGRAKSQRRGRDVAVIQRLRTIPVSASLNTPAFNAAGDRIAQGTQIKVCRAFG